MIFKGAILGDARKFHMDSYLNGTIVPFDNKYTYVVLSSVIGPILSVGLSTRVLIL